MPLAQHSDYKKWLRYYVDFRDKYRLEATSSKSQAQFVDKLREKKQTDQQIKQAAHAWSLDWDVQRALKPSAAASGAEPLSKAAVRRVKLTKRISSHTFRHSFATHLLQANFDIRSLTYKEEYRDEKTIAGLGKNEVSRYDFFGLE